MDHPTDALHYGARAYRMSDSADDIQVVQVDKPKGTKAKYTGSKIPPGHPQNRYDNHPTRDGAKYPVDVILSKKHHALLGDAVTLQSKRINFVSVRDGIDLVTPAGRLIANVLASVAEYENEVRGERVRAGQSAARAAGKRWGGSIKGRRLKVTDEAVATIQRMSAEGASKAAMARATGLSRPTIYAVLGSLPKT